MIRIEVLFDLFESALLAIYQWCHDVTIMGIDKSRFVDDNHKIFICPVCEDVADNPVLLNCCESFVCTSCHTNETNGYSFPACGENHDKSSKLIGIQKQLRELYSRLKLKCIYDECHEILLLENHSQHESNCKSRKCAKCGSKDVGEDHNCVDWLKSENKRLKNEIEQVRKQLEEARERTRIVREKLEMGKGNGDVVHKPNIASHEPMSMKIFQNGSVENPRFEERFSFNDSETTATPEVKNLIKRTLLEFHSDRTLKFIALPMMLHRVTRKKWVVQRKCMFDATKYDIPRLTYCSFRFNDSHFVAFQGDFNSVIGRDAEEIKRVVREIDSSTSFKTEVSGERQRRARLISDDLEAVYGGFCYAFVHRSMLNCIHSTDAVFWKLYVFKDPSLEFCYSKFVKFVTAVTNVDVVTKKLLLRAVMESFLDGKTGSDLAASAAERARGFIDSSDWHGYILSPGMPQSSSVINKATLEFFNGQTYVFCSEGRDRKGHFPGRKVEQS